MRGGVGREEIKEAWGGREESNREKIESREIQSERQAGRHHEEIQGETQRHKD